MREQSNSRPVAGWRHLTRMVALLCIIAMLVAACGNGSDADETTTTADGSATTEGESTDTTEGESTDTTEGSTATTMAEAEYEGVEEIEPITLTVTDIAPDSSPQGAAFQAFADRITEASDGRIEFEFYWSASLLTGPEVPEGIGAGIADLGFTFPGYVPELHPVTEWVIGLGSTFDPSFPVGTLQGVGAHAEQMLDNPDVVAELGNLNLKLLTPLVATQFFDATCTTPIETLEDAEGASIRTSNATYAAEAEAIGMVPANIGAAEMYEALQRGIVDCVNLWPPISIPFSMWDVGTEYTPIQFNGFNGYYMVINQDTWDSLPLVGQQIIWDSLGVFARTYHDGVQALYRQWAEEGPDKGLTFHAPSEELASTLSDFQEEYVANMPSTAPDGVTDPQAVIDDYQVALDKWRGIIVDDLGYPVFGTSAEETIESFSAELDLDAFQQALEEEVYAPRRP